MSTTTYISELNGQKLCAERAAYTVEGKDIDESLEDLASNTSALIAGSNVNITSTASGITVSVPDGSTSTKGALQLAGSIGATVSTENGKAASEKAVRDAIDGISNTLEIVTTSSSYSDITNIIAAGKFPVLQSATSGSAYYYQLSTINSAAIVFSRTIDDNSISYKRVLPSGTWQSGFAMLENTANKVTTIRAASSATDTDYPSEKAVRTTIDSLKLTDLGGTLTVAKGGTGATTAAGAMRALTEDKIGTGTQYFITITEQWARSGYCSVADAKTVLGLGSAAYQNTSAFAPNSHTHTTSEITDFGSYVTHRGNAGKSNMNDVGKLYPSVGMTSLSDPGNTVDNPLTGTDKSTSWHLYWDASYSDNPSGSNAWVAQICNKAGTAQWWVRSRSGGSITNGTAWAAGWEHVTIAPQAGQGSGTQPVYVDKYGHTQNCTYSLSKSVPSDAKFTDTVYTHPTTSGNKHIPSGGSSGQILRWSADGTAAWGADNNTTYSAGSGLSLSGTTFSLKTGYTTSGKNYKVQLDSSGNPYVNVPWTDNNTTYSAGTGLSLSGTSFSLNIGIWSKNGNFFIPRLPTIWTNANINIANDSNAVAKSARENGYGTPLIVYNGGSAAITVTRTTSGSTATINAYKCKLFIVTSPGDGFYDPMT